MQKSFNAFTVTLLLVLLGLPFVGIAQNKLDIAVRLDEDNRLLTIQQDVTFLNTSSDTLDVIYFNDWANSFASKRSGLGIRFEENYDRRFHLAPEEDRGSSKINNIIDENFRNLKFKRLPDAEDILRVNLNKPLLPGQAQKIKMNYNIRVPDSKFTGYGVLNNGDYNLKYWFIAPAVYDGTWQYYSNKNLDDLFMAPTDFSIDFSFQSDFTLINELDMQPEEFSANAQFKTVHLEGDNRNNTTIYLRKKSEFDSTETDAFTVVTNIKDRKVIPEREAIIIDKITGFLTEKLGNYPFDKLVISVIDYRDNPVYGLNQLPDFLSPFPEDFKYELKILKTTIDNYVDRTLYINPRKDRWIADAIKMYTMMQYMDHYYPNLKVVGTLNRYWLARQFHLSEMEFNEQFNLLYLHMARMNLDQPLKTPSDSLIKFNKNIANAYKAGSGFNYLSEYLSDQIMEESIDEFYSQNKLKLTSSKVFEAILREKAPKNLDWFFNDFVSTRKTIDFKFNEVKRRGDSIAIEVRNKTKAKVPVPVYAMYKDSLISKTWVEPFVGEKDTVIYAPGADRVVLNKEGFIPEFNRRNNYKKVNPFLGVNKPFQFKLFQDLEDPAKNQVFFMPVAEYNFYDGLKLGAKMYNKTILQKPFSYKIEPQYGLKSNQLTGSAGFSYTQNLDEGNLFAIRFGAGGSLSSYAPDALYKTFSPFLTFAFRETDFRSDRRQYLTVRNINIYREESNVIENDAPNYSVFNVQYTNSSPGVINALTYSADFELSQKFSKFSVTAKYRRVFLNNRQLDLRFFGGTFLYNDTRARGDYFSFALDRPTDYLFSYNYYGRSEDTGIYSQQLIMAEGGFKSKLDTPFGNQWLTSINASTTLWSFIHGYVDFGLVKNESDPARFLYDSGIRTVLVEDYFELFFPVYSSKGWEIAQPDYDQKIRFIVTLDLRTMLKLFTRKWY
ncbi:MULTISPECIES: metalloprotease [unclassified Leeuwenhoekiella]|uniref:metalloprotease n=1 Tax=unclassified Leeuwenhoekiella TaxID=2615029 RepID=UPI000C53285F|nr:MULTISPECIES: metalloprotease [unclassified Leeuwenhoekiella]MAW95072.1 metalloprotease [Leeuwenhoekiella sp.]MBA79792.1 metalloprotease [Leeuwenhoekiella sp.]|tara:strand:+ start:889 stop:3732 length:2844 start_codon:yes stop_codon:yes gene_type:complete